YIRDRLAHEFSVPQAGDLIRVVAYRPTPDLWIEAPDQRKAIIQRKAIPILFLFLCQPARR
ncbi:MAG: hypothetical protein ACREX9_15485, partial [Gammaproteobacteria bacterium]